MILNNDRIPSSETAMGAQVVSEIHRQNYNGRCSHCVAMVMRHTMVLWLMKEAGTTKNKTMTEIRCCWTPVSRRPEFN